eukprot:403356322
MGSVHFICMLQEIKTKISICFLRFVPLKSINKLEIAGMLEITRQKETGYSNFYVHRIDNNFLTLGGFQERLTPITGQNQKVKIVISDQLVQQKSSVQNKSLSSFLQNEKDADNQSNMIQAKPSLILPNIQKCMNKTITNRQLIDQHDHMFNSKVLASIYQPKQIKILVDKCQTESLNQKQMNEDSWIERGSRDEDSVRQSYEPIIKVKPEKRQIQERMNVLMNSNFDFRFIPKPKPAITPKLDLPTKAKMLRKQQSLQQLMQDQSMSVQNRSQDSNSSIIQENQANFSKFLRNVENCRKKFTKDTVKFKQNHHQFRTYVNDLEEYIDFKLLNPFEKQKEEVRQELLEKSNVYKLKNAQIKRKTQKFQQSIQRSQSIQLMKSFNGYIDMESGPTFNKDISRKLIESAIKEEKFKSKNFVVNHL